VDLSFFVPGTDTPGVTRGFGAVYTDIDNAENTAFEYFDVDGNSLGQFPAPVSKGGLSFLGAVFPDPVVARVRIEYGSGKLGPDESADYDVAVMDDFIYGEPQPNARPQVTLRGVPRAIRLRRLVRRGIRIRLTPNEAVSVRAALLASVREVRVARNELALASRRLGRALGTRTLRLRPKRRLLRDTPRTFRIRLVVEATDALGLSRTVRRTIRVRR
jgi:hypothetical protein